MANVFEDPAVPLLPELPVQKYDDGVEVAAQVFGHPLPNLQPPVLRAGESLAWDGEVAVGPGSDQLPGTGAERAVHEQMRARLGCRKAELADIAVWPATLLEIVRSQAALVHSEPHEEFASGRRLRFPDWSSAGKFDVCGKEQLVGAAVGEVSVLRVPPDQPVLLPRL